MIVKYEIQLPSIVPPSYRGKCIRISYKLVLGVQRPGAGMATQVFEFPFRVFGAVAGMKPYIDSILFILR
jgi:RAB6A-GEF complex partner protein 2